MTKSVGAMAVGRLHAAKSAYTTRNVDFNEARTLIGGKDVRPRAGDVVLARVTSIGHHKGLELQQGRKAQMFVGDEIIVVCGNRYAPDQFEAEVCHDLGECDLVAAGGIAACVLSRHDATRKPTRISPIGLLGDRDGTVINLARYALAATKRPKSALAIGVLGASMNAGKTTTAFSLVRGLTAAGYCVGAAKVTGTGSGGDIWAMTDAGAKPAIDFTAAGYASTYHTPPREIEQIFTTLTGELMRAGANAIVIEVADGLYQQETSFLANSDLFRDFVDGVVFASRDALGASAAVEWLREAKLNVLALSGVITRSPLAIQEATEATGLPVLGPDELSTGKTIAELIAPITESWRKSA